MNERPEFRTEVKIEDLNQIGKPFQVTMAWLRRIMSPLWRYELHTERCAHSEYERVSKVTQNVADIANRKISEYLSAGATIVLIGGGFYHILEPKRELFVALTSSDVHILGKDRQVFVPTLQGKLSARIFVDRLNDTAQFNVTCDDISVISEFKRTASQNPTLYALFDNVLNRLPDGILIFGRQTNKRLLKLKEAA